MEKNPTIVNFPVKSLDLGAVLPVPEGGSLSGHPECKGGRALDGPWPGRCGAGCAGRGWRRWHCSPAASRQLQTRRLDDFTAVQARAAPRRPPSTTWWPTWCTRARRARGRARTACTCTARCARRGGGWRGACGDGRGLLDAQWRSACLRMPAAAALVAPSSRCVLRPSPAPVVCPSAGGGAVVRGAGPARDRGAAPDGGAVGGLPPGLRAQARGRAVAGRAGRRPDSRPRCQGAAGGLLGSLGGGLARAWPRRGCAVCLPLLCCEAGCKHLQLERSGGSARGGVMWMQTDQMKWC